MKNKAIFLKSFVLAMALLICIVFALVGCGDGETTDTSSSASTQSSVDTSSSATDSSTENSTTDSSTDTAPCAHEGGTATCSAKATCTKCGEEYGDFLAHDYAEATCTVAKTCKACSATEGEALGHDEQDNVVAPTCTEAGITNVTCSRCDYTATKDPTEALGHNEQDNVVAPTCTEAGITNITCSRCDYTATKAPTDALGHDHSQFVKKVAPTCSEDGYDEYKCIRCTDKIGVENGEKATGEHELAYFKTVKPTCTVVGHKLYKCKTCTLTWKNPDLNTPNEPLPEDIVPTIDHNYDYATIDGLVACFMCSKGYRDVTVENQGGEDVFCMGCGNDPCTCGSSGEWNGYTPAKDPEQLTQDVKFTKSEVVLTEGTKALQIGGGLIVLTGESDTEYTIVVYSSVDGEPTDTIEVSGDYILVFLDSYDSVEKVEITASTDATVSFYTAE